MSILISKILLYTVRNEEREIYNKYYLSEDNVYNGLVDFAFWAYGRINIENIEIWAIIEIDVWDEFGLRPTDFRKEHIPDELISDCKEFNQFLKKLFENIDTFKTS